MNRREARIRRDYLYRKSIEFEEQQKYEKKLKIKQALEQDKKLPHDLKKEAHLLQKDFMYDDYQQQNQDDEYSNCGEFPPRILITTSRDPSSRLSQFAKELKLLIPNSQRINRGRYQIDDIVRACRENNVTDLIIVNENKGNPDCMMVSHFPYGPTAYFSLSNVVLRHDIQEKSTMSTAYPHLIFDNFQTKLGKRVVQILKHLFPVVNDGKRVLTFANNMDYISFRHHVFYKHKRVEIAEVGPRFEMRVFKILMGTIEIKEADVEFALKPYQRTMRKRDLL